MTPSMTPARVAQFHKLWTATKPNGRPYQRAEIAAQLGVTTSALIAWIGRRYVAGERDADISRRGRWHEGEWRLVWQLRRHESERPP